MTRGVASTLPNRRYGLQMLWMRVFRAEPGQDAGVIPENHIRA
jgi:hypothetical protein